MKNIHILPTDKPSRLYIGDNLNFVFGMIQTYIQSRNNDFTNQHIYITSDVDIQKGDWYYTNRFGIGITKNEGDSKIERTTKSYKKIILTTDQGLIKDGVQAIDDEFLEWFVKNPSCEMVEVKKGFADGSAYGYDFLSYKIIIPQEDPEPEFCDNCNNDVCCCIIKERRMYSEEEVKQFAFECVTNFLSNSENKVEIGLVDVILDRNNKKFEQFKNK
jgi:hypothetical protein